MTILILKGLHNYDNSHEIKKIDLYQTYIDFLLKVFSLVHFTK